jgi:hypothetical protein
MWTLGGQPKHLKLELPRTSPNILAREDVLVSQHLKIVDAGKVVFSIAAFAKLLAGD